MKIKNFTNFNSVNEEFVPKKITKDSRTEALAGLSSTLDKNKLEKLNHLLLAIAAFYSTESLTAYNKETGANIFPTTSTEVRKHYDEFCKGLDVDQFQMLTVVLSSFAKDLRIDSENIAFQSRAMASKFNAQKAPVEATTGAGASMARESYKSRR
jgi:regulator of PEP synthase PpsR (kinase-PPPase family)